MVSKTGSILPSIEDIKRNLGKLDLDKEVKKVFKIIAAYESDPTSPGFMKDMKAWRASVRAKGG